MSGILNTPLLAVESAGGPLTLEDFMAAVKAVEDQPYPEPHRHLVSPDGAKRLAEGGRTLCHSCGQMIGSR